MAELFDICDRNRIPTGGTIERGSAFPDGQYHQVIHICIFNKAGQMLIQQRQPCKRSWPNMWDVSVGGSVIAGEDPAMGARRELKEELGLDYDFSGVRPQVTVNFAYGFDDYFIIGMELDPAELSLQPEEVRSARWAGREEILEMIRDGRFIPYYPEFINYLFATRFHYGSTLLG